jgi:hypothetical protein
MIRDAKRPNSIIGKVTASPAWRIINGSFVNPAKYRALRVIERANILPARYHVCGTRTALLRKRRIYRCARFIRAFIPEDSRSEG